MYCRECGRIIEDNAKYCSACGSEVILLAQPETIKEKKQNTIPNPYTNYAIYITVLGIALSVFPWPRSWGVGTSYWMVIGLIVIGLCGYMLYRKAIQFNKQLLDKHIDKAKLGWLTFVRFGSTLIIISATVTLVSKLNFF